MQQIKLLLLLNLSLILSACGGGGGGTSVEQEPLKTLYFIDAPVNGLSYQCGNREGKTQSTTINGELKHGVAKCRKGSVTFSIDKFVIGTVNSYHDHQKIYLADFLDLSNGLVDNIELIKLGMLIQSLDDDGNIETKIDIDNNLTINITSLERFKTTDALQEYIHSLGKQARGKEEVVEHIVKHIDPKYGQKPTVKPLEITVSSDEMVGNSIGNLTIDSGDASLLKITLSGNGGDYFEIINNSEIRLKQKLNQTTPIELTVHAINKFGESSGALTIHIIPNSKVAKIELGALANATVKIYQLSSNGKKELLTTTTSNQNGDFDLKINYLNKQSFYIYEIRGGETSSSDIDRDGIKDEFSTANQGVVRLILKKEWISNATHPIHASTLSEMLYLYSVDTLNNSYSDLDKKLDQIAKILLQDDLNSDGKIDAQDTLIFNPSVDKNLLTSSIAKEYDQIAIDILYNNPKRFKNIFDTKVIKAFDANASGCSPTTLCAFELTPTKMKYRNGIVYTLKDNRLFLYDTKQNRTISYIDIPNGAYGLYLDLQNGRIFLSAQNQEIITIDLTNLEKPQILATKFPTQGYILGKVDVNVLIYQNNELIIVESSNINQLQEIARYTLPRFDQIIYNDAYSFTISNNQLTIKQYNLANLQNISLRTTYQLSNITNSTKVYMDTQKYIYILTPNQSLGIYTINNETIQALSSLELNATEILNINENYLYTYGHRKIHQIDKEYSISPRVTSTFDFKQTTNALYFDERILYTPRYMIDINALMLSSPYITIDKNRALDKEYDINLEMIKDTTLFDPF